LAQIPHSGPVLPARIISLVKLPQIPLRQTVACKWPPVAARPGCDAGIHVTVTLLDGFSLLRLPRSHYRPDVNRVHPCIRTVVDPSAVVDVRVLHHTMRATVSNQQHRSPPDRHKMPVTLQRLAKRGQAEQAKKSKTS